MILRCLSRLKGSASTCFCIIRKTNENEYLKQTQQSLQTIKMLAIDDFLGEITCLSSTRGNPGSTFSITLSAQPSSPICRIAFGLVCIDTIITRSLDSISFSCLVPDLLLCGWPSLNVPVFLVTADSSIFVTEFNYLDQVDLLSFISSDFEDQLIKSVISDQDFSPFEPIFNDHNEPRSAFSRQFQQNLYSPSSSRFSFDFNPADLVENWTECELLSYRKIVTLARSQVGSTSIIGLCFDARSTETFQFSLIKNDDFFYISSVDVIALFEFIHSRVDSQKRLRVRRILEEFRPTLVEKGTEWYTRFMDYKNPRPRKVAKNTKVFEWKNVPAMMVKIEGYLV